MPPLQNWLFGSGISLIVIGIGFLVCNWSEEPKEWHNTSRNVLAVLSSLFLPCWAIVGSVNVAGPGKDCLDVEEPWMWRFSVAAIVFCFFAWLLGLTVIYQMCKSRGGGDEQEAEVDKV